jgi:hypothetical protein
MSTATNDMTNWNVPTTKTKKNSKYAERIQYLKEQWIVIALNCVVWPLAFYLKVFVNG